MSDQRSPGSEVGILRDGSVTVQFDCGHREAIARDEYGDGSAAMTGRTQSEFGIPRRSFTRRYCRLYRYYRGHLEGTLYAASGYSPSRRRSIKLAWRYARKGGGQYV